MLQKFNENTIQSGLVKHILTNIPIPLLDTVRYGDYIMEGFYYIYLTYIIKCTQSGYLVPDSEQIVVSEDLICSDTTYIGSESAKFDVVETFFFGDFKENISKYHVLNNSSYDIETHILLGKYLRCYRDLLSINMMSFYNCYCNQHTSIFSLDKTSDNYISFDVFDNRQIILVPIQFNKKYTICIDSNSQVQLKSVIYDYDTQRLIKYDSSRYVTDLLNEPITTYMSLSFKSPIIYSISCTDVNIYNYKKYLYLAIQLPKSNNSSIVVLEGDYTNTGKSIISTENINNIRSDILDDALLSKLSLMSLNDNLTYAFSNKLIEFLSLHMITSQETISKNVLRLQEGVGYSTGTKDVWDNKLRYFLYNKYMETNSSAFDVTGYGDKLIEDVLRGKNS